MGTFLRLGDVGRDARFEMLQPLTRGIFFLELRLSLYCMRDSVLTVFGFKLLCLSAKSKCALFFCKTATAAGVHIYSCGSSPCVNFVSISLRQENATGKVKVGGGNESKSKNAQFSRLRRDFLPRFLLPLSPRMKLPPIIFHFLDSFLFCISWCSCGRNPRSKLHT